MFSASPRAQLHMLHVQERLRDWHNSTSDVNAEMKHSLTAADKHFAASATLPEHSVSPSTINAVRRTSLADTAALILTPRCSIGSSLRNEYSPFSTPRSSSGSTLLRRDSQPGNVVILFGFTRTPVIKESATPARERYATAPTAAQGGLSHPSGASHAGTGRDNDHLGARMRGSDVRGPVAQLPTTRLAFESEMAKLPLNHSPVLLADDSDDATVSSISDMEAMEEDEFTMFAN